MGEERRGEGFLAGRFCGWWGEGGGGGERYMVGAVGGRYMQGGDEDGGVMGRVGEKKVGMERKSLRGKVVY